ncbi:cytochrome P450 [Mycena crocata]|nr:cytochrome P450 [Mycena crocata]
MLILQSATAADWVTLAAIIFLFYGIYKTAASRSKLPLPPGPRKLPIVGNFFDLPPTFQWERFMQWSRQYKSDILHLNLAGTSVIVLSSLEATGALLEKRSSIYSDRLQSPMINDLMGVDWSLGLMRYGDAWRKHRRLLNQGFNTVASKTFHPKERLATQTLLRRLFADPDGWMEHLRHMAGELILSITYGINVLPDNDPYIDVAEKTLKAFSEASVPGRFLVESFPILTYIPEWVPGAHFKRFAREGRELFGSLLQLPFAETKRQMALGSGPASFTMDALRALESSVQYYDEDTLKGTSAAMYAAGADTTVAALSTFFLAMLANRTPENTPKSQAEIDSVIGRGNLPDFADEDALPYVGAVVKEVLRWKPVAPFGVPHFLPIEDEYQGYRIPAGSIVIGNIWAILHDEAMYPDPYSFKPERFLLNGKPNPEIKDPQAAWGFGRRICPGRHMANSSIWITMASVLSVFDITKAVDKNGQIIEPSFEYFSGLVSAPIPFKCSTRPRSGEAVSLIQATANVI